MTGYINTPERRNFVRRALILEFLLAFMIAAVVVIGLFEANDWIDRCADYESGKHIEDPIKRQLACK